jgi:hypothetical protein
MKWFLRFVVLFCGAVLVIFWGKRKIDRTPIARQIKLADIQGISTTGAIAWPKGENFHFVIGSNPTSSWSGSTSQGVLQFFSQTQLISQFGFSHETTSHCNWLDKHLLQGTVLDWAAKWKASEIFSAGENYDVALIFSNPPPVPCSLWLTYIQSHKDFRAEARPANVKVER